MNSSKIRRRFLNFFEKRGHAIIDSASLVTTDEKNVTDSTLFNTAGMQPLAPYLLGKIHPKGNRLADVQKCLRTIDLDDVGDKTHATFFEMLGNWSLGDYFKKDAINWSYEFLTDKNEGLGLDPSRLYVTVFEGNSNSPKDDEAVEIWQEVFAKNSVDIGNDTSNIRNSGRIFYMPANANWWEAGENGPCGPDTEMYYDITGKFGGKCLTKEQFIEAESQKEIVEVWNDVFMQYEKKNGKIVGKLAKPSVDTGAGLERLAMIMQGVDNIYETDLLKPVMDNIEQKKNKKHLQDWDIKSVRIIADHVRAAIFLIADGVIPSNIGRGYVLRKLIRRAIRQQKLIKLEISNLSEFVPIVIEIYRKTYPTLVRKERQIKEIFSQEGGKFIQVLHSGDLEIDDLIKKAIHEKRSISGKESFILYSSYGFPIEETVKIAKTKGIDVDIVGFEDEFKKHQELSRSGAEQKFKGGLANSQDEMVVRYHTATHLLHQALHDVLGEGANQKGSNITKERLRFDFSHSVRMADEQKKRVEDIVNQKINEALPVNNVILSREDAEKTGARHFFGEKYGDQISIFFVGHASRPPTIAELKNAYSKEFCGGPHVKNTKELTGPEGKWMFKIQKEEAVAQGIRRIKAVLN
ncbi:MAG: alanine--tRNA ligase [Patescibacteria group bacterium]